jgi:hypothetical protein
MLTTTATVDFRQQLEVSLTRGADLVYSAVLPAQSLEGLGPTSFRYSAPSARKGGGGFALKAKQLSGVGYRLTFKGYGSLGKAGEGMVTHVTVEAQTWSSHGLWAQTNHGWKLADGNFAP